MILLLYVSRANSMTTLFKNKEIICKENSKKLSKEYLKKIKTKLMKLKK